MPYKFPSVRLTLARLLGARGLLLLLFPAAAKLIIHFCTNSGYGYFRDELYYIACAERLDFGYVDHPPFSILLLVLIRPVLNDSLFALRLVPVVTGAFVVMLTALITREMGGGRFAQGVAGLGALIMPVFLATHNFYSMNAFDHLFWAVSVYLIIRILKEDRRSYWIMLGFAIGLGLLNKVSILFLSLGFFVGLLLTEDRKFLLRKWTWMAGVIALTIFSPYIIWQLIHEWPTLEFMRNAKRFKIYPASPLDFFLGQVVEAHPFLLPVWLLGLCYYFLVVVGKRFRLLGWIFLTVFVLLVALRGKGYYLAPAYPLLFAGGSIMLEEILNRASQRWLKPAVVGTLTIGGFLTAPLAIPVLPVEMFISYSKILKIRPRPGERYEIGVLPQHFADMFGWEGMVSAVADVYLDLPAEERPRCAILASNYGQAGAIDFFGGKYGLPRAICAHNNYYLWGPRDYTGDIVISLMDRESLERVFLEVTQASIVRRKYSMPYEDNRPIYVCRKPRVSLQEVWPELKSFI